VRWATCNGGRGHRGHPTLAHPLMPATIDASAAASSDGAAPAAASSGGAAPAAASSDGAAPRRRDLRIL
jgi:hypothetical protein